MNSTHVLFLGCYNRIQTAAFYLRREITNFFPAIHLRRIVLLLCRISFSDQAQISNPPCNVKIPLLWDCVSTMLFPDAQGFVFEGEGVSFLLCAAPRAEWAATSSFKVGAFLKKLIPVLHAPLRKSDSSSQHTNCSVLRNNLREAVFKEISGEIRPIKHRSWNITRLNKLWCLSDSNICFCYVLLPGFKTADILSD